MVALFLGYNREIMPFFSVITEKNVFLYKKDSDAHQKSTHGNDRKTLVARKSGFVIGSTSGRKVDHPG
jgi:hypothetical protein